MNSLSTPIQTSSFKKTGNLDWILITGSIFLALLISFFSAYHTVEVPFDLAWQFSPLGLLSGVKPENLDLESFGYFQGHFGLTPDYFFVYFKTCLIEFPFYYLCFRNQAPIRILSILFVANFLTHPIVFFVIPLLFNRYLTTLLFSEAFAPVTEVALAYYLLSREMEGKKAFPRSLWILLANLMSWQVGSFL